MKKYIKPTTTECVFSFAERIAQQIHDGSVDIQLTKDREDEAAEKETEEKDSWTEGLW